MKLTHEIVEQVLSPLRASPFEIPFDGTSQTRLANTGRFGFFVERIFGISPNSSRDPDTDYGEIKTVRVTGNSVKPISIGTIPIGEYDKLSLSSFPSFESSDPFKKMKKTLYVFYRVVESFGNPKYIIEGWIHLDMSAILENDRQWLAVDYHHCVEAMKSQSYYKLSGSSGRRPSTRYLQLSYKGDACYTYPCWKFSTEWMQNMRKLANQNMKKLASQKV